MLTIVPLMIWSARTMIDSQAWRSETTIADEDAATKAISRGRVSPKTR